MEGPLRLYHNPFSSSTQYCFLPFPSIDIVLKISPQCNTWVLISISESASRETQLATMPGVVQEKRCSYGVPKLPPTHQLAVRMLIIRTRRSVATWEKNGVTSWWSPGLPLDIPLLILMIHEQTQQSCLRRAWRPRARRPRAQSPQESRSGSCQ